MSRSYYLFLGLFLFGLIHLPSSWTDCWRAQAAQTLAPAWRSVSPAGKAKSSGINASEAQIEALQEWLKEEKRIEELSSHVAALLQANPTQMAADYQRRVQRQVELLRMRFTAMPAQVIFRDPSSWSSVLWIGLGESDNRAIGRVVIARNSPVLLENSLVGVVEYVGESQSRVRLITDSSLSVAVRASRGQGQNRELLSLVNALLERVAIRADLFSSVQEQESVIEILSSFQKRMHLFGEELLAKGEISGCSAPLWRARGALLKGIGFNYDYPDAEGPARDLRTGKPFGYLIEAAKPLLQEGDLLVTSGLDGIFPPGIAVAIAKTIEPLSEGSSSYELKAIPTAGDLTDLHTLLVLPPL